jgi:hypothetical protein
VLRNSGLLAVQTREGLEFRPFGEVALALDEYEGRLTIVLADGAVAHRPGPLAAFGEMVPLADGVMGNARHGVVRGDFFEFPAGWKFPRVKLPNAPRVAEATAAALKIGSRRLDSTRLRGLRAEGTRYRVNLDDGTSFFVMYKAALELVAQLGVALNHLEPCSEKHRAMYRLGLRDFPYVLLDASDAELKRVFGTDERTCIANLIWEVPRHRALGTPLDYGTEHRGFYYRPILPVLNRLGLMDRRTRAALSYIPTDVLLGALANGTYNLLGGFSDPHYQLYGKILSEMIGDSRLITLRDLGFAPTRPDLRALGTARPEWLLAVEKSSLENEAREVARRFGVSLVILGGMARWQATEPLADLLRPVLAGRRVNVVNYGDFDPDGWEIADVLVSQLARYDIAAVVVGHIALPRRFTEREISLLAEPLPSNDAQTQAWMAKTHGIDGKPLRMHADHLRPLERVIAAFKEESGLTEVAG